MEWASKILEAAKLPTKFVVAVFLASTLLLFLSPEIILKLRLEKLLQEYGRYLGIASILSGSVLAIDLIAWLSRKLKKYFLRRKIRNLSKERLKSLDQAEKAVLREFFIQGRNTIKLPMDHPVVAGLLSAGVLTVVGQHGKHSLAGMLFSMKIPDVLSEEFTYEMLDLPAGEPSEEDVEFIRENRPAFMDRIERDEALLR